MAATVRRGAWGLAAALLLAYALVLVGPGGASVGADAHAAHPVGHVHAAHRAEMDRVATANGMRRDAPDGFCRSWYRFDTARGPHCSQGPMPADRFTAAQRAPAVAAGTSASGADAKVTCIGDGASGKRVQLVYARRANKADGSAAAAVQMKAWAAGIESIMVLSAQKTGGVRKVRWAHDASCVPTVLVLTVANTVTDFSGLVSALEAQGLTSSSRKYLVAWDDGDATASFCGLGQTMPDSKAGPTNNNETQPIGALFAALEPDCWSTYVAAHELMHTLGAVQDDAPHATGYGHCTDESDIMCYVDGPGVVMANVCPASQEDLYDCKDDDYFSTSPPAGSYLQTHWNPASSGWLDQSGSVGPPSAPEGAVAVAVAGAGSVTVTWSPPQYDGGSKVLAYLLTVSPGGRTVAVAAPSTQATVPGLADGTPVSVAIAAVNARGSGVSATTGSVTPSPVVTSIRTSAVDATYHDLARGPDGTAYVSESDRITAIAPDGGQTLVVGGGDLGGENTLPTEAAIAPRALAVAANGDLCWYDADNGKIRRLHAGRVNSVAGSGAYGATGDGGAATAAAIRVDGLAVSPVDGSILFVDAAASVVRRVVVGGTISRVAGTTGTPGDQGDGGAATAARLNGPSDLAVSASGTVYVADTMNNKVKAFTVGGTISTVAGDGTTLIYPGATLTATTTGVAYPSAIDWSADRGLLIDSFGLIRRLSGTDLIRVAGDLFDDTASDADGTPATVIAYGKNDTIDAITWAASTLHVLARGPAPAGGERSRVRAAGPWSSGVASTAPGAPIVAPVATAGQSSATVTWVAAANGGSAITGYRITASPGGATLDVGDVTSAKVTGLTPGTAYRFAVTAENAIGSGPPSAQSNAVTPSAPPAYAPFASWAAFVDRQFRDVTGAPPSAADSAAWVTKLGGGTATKGGLVDALRRGTENTTNVDPTTRLYRAFLGRTPDKGGLTFWIARRRTGTWSLTRIADFFAGSSEFTAKYGSLTNRAFVTLIYTDVLGRAADPAGVDFWTGQLDKGRRTRGGVMVGFSESNEYKTKQANNVDAAVAHVFLLGRAPTSAEVTTWATRRTGGTGHDVLLGELLASDAYAARIAAL